MIGQFDSLGNHLPVLQVDNPLQYKRNAIIPVVTVTGRGFASQGILNSLPQSQAVGMVV